MAKKKKAMDKDFNKNFVKPTDKNFVYDKKVDFSKGRNIEDEASFRRAVLAEQKIRKFPVCCSLSQSARNEI